MYHNKQLSPLAKLRLVLGAAVGLVLLGVLGFGLLEDMGPLDALYMTIITISTVGFGEVQPLHWAGRIFVMFLIVGGVGMAWFTASIVGQIIIEGQLRELLGKRKMESKIRKMKNHYIIAGYGRVGRQVALEFMRRKVPFVVIEKTDAEIQNLQHEGAICVQGEATDDDVLRKAGIESARTLISTLPDEAQNVYLTLTARFMNRDLKIIARADYDEGVKKLHRAGADHVVSPHVLGGMRMAMACLRPNVVDFMHTASLGDGGLSIEEIMIPSGSPLVDKTLIESQLKQDYGVHIIGVKKPGGAMELAPGPNTRLGESDILVLIGQTEGLEKLGQKLG
jgi:voltage-gated potassium channel